MKSKLKVCDKKRSCWRNHYRSVVDNDMSNAKSSECWIHIVFYKRFFISFSEYMKLFQEILLLNFDLYVLLHWIIYHFIFHFESGAWENRYVMNIVQQGFLSASLRNLYEPFCGLNASNVRSSVQNRINPWRVLLTLLLLNKNG